MKPTWYKALEQKQAGMQASFPAPTVDFPSKHKHRHVQKHRIHTSKTPNHHTSVAPVTLQSYRTAKHNQANRKELSLSSQQTTPSQKDTGGDK